MTSNQMVQERTSGRQIGIALLVGYFVVYAGILFAMHRLDNFKFADPLLILAILGVGFSLAAWLLTIGLDPLGYSIVKPRKELNVIGI